MKKSLQITNLSEEIMVDIIDNRLPLNNILLKGSRLSLLLDMAENVERFKKWSIDAEAKQFIVDTYQINMESAKDRDIAVTSANPNQHVYNPVGNVFERSRLRDDAKIASDKLASYRAETYNFALNVFTKWQFGNIAESIFEKKRERIEPLLVKLFPDINQRLNSIDQNISSKNQEDWKNSVASCRTLLMDIANLLNPPKGQDDKDKFINRLKDFVSPLISSKTKKKLVKSYFDELKNRIEYTMDLTQGGAHQNRPIKKEAEDVVLYTYLLIADLMDIYQSSNEQIEPSN